MCIIIRSIISFENHSKYWNTWCTIKTYIRIRQMSQRIHNRTNRWIMVYWPPKSERYLNDMTQRGTISTLVLISRQYKADRIFQVKRLNCKLSCDTMWSDIRLLNENICTQGYTHTFELEISYPFPRIDGDCVGQSLQSLIHDYGTPAHLTFDGAVVQSGMNKLFMKTLRKYEVSYHISLPRQPH